MLFRSVAEGRAKDAPQTVSRTTSMGYVRANVHRIGVVRGGAAPMMMELHDHDVAHDFGHDHAHDQEIGVLFDHVNDAVDLSEIASSVEASLASVSAQLTNPVGMQVAAIETRMAAGTREVHAIRVAEAKMKGYEGDACGSCGNFTLVRNGTCMKCNTCGSTSGCS